MPLLVLLGGWVAYVKFNHASRPREESVRSLGAVLSDIAVPEPLFKEARKEEGSRVFEDYATYREFLERHGLAQSVVITRSCSEEGAFLFHAFPPLDDPNTFSHFIVRLPNLAPGRAHGQPPADRTRVHSLPAVQLSTRSAAEEFLSTGFFLRPSLEETRIPGGASAQRGESEESHIGVRARGQQDSTPSAERR